jgi:hypothetical protein
MDTVTTTAHVPELVQSILCPQIKTGFKLRMLYYNEW